MSRIVHLSDLHFGDEEPALVEQLLDAVTARAPHVIVATGDLTQKGKRSEFESAAGFFDRIDAPKLIAPGNHDTPMFNVFARVTAPFARFAKRIAAGAAPMYVDGNMAAGAFNTARGVQLRWDWSLGHASERDARALAEEVGLAGGDGAARVVACHHPLVTPSKAPFPARTRNGRRVAKAFAELGVDLVLSGHMHVRFAEPLPFGDEKTYAVGAGTALSRRTRGEPVGFNVVEVLDDAIVVEGVESRGGPFETVEVRRLRRRPGPPAGASDVL